MYKLRVAGGLKKGQSLAIRTGGLVVVRNYYEEPLEDLEQYLAKNLQDEIQKLKRFSDTKIISEPDPRPAGLALEEPRPAGLILEDPRQSSAENLQDEIQKPERSSATRMISEPDPRPADLVLEGFFTGIDKGSRVKRMLGPPDQAANVTVSVSGVIKRTSDGEKVLEFSCMSSSMGGLIGMGGLLARGAKPMIHSGIRSLAWQIAQTIVKSDKKPSSTKGRFMREIRAK